MNGRSLIFSILFVFSELKCDDTDENDQHGTIYQFQAKNIDGKMVSMEKYR